MKNELIVSVSVVFISFTFVGSTFGDSKCCPGPCCPPAPVESYSERTSTQHSVPAAEIQMKLPIIAPQSNAKESDEEAVKSSHTGTKSEDRQLSPETAEKELPTTK
jgi:hypothetical protein